jgi:hypothetical protein
MEHLEGLVKLAGNEIKAIVENGKFRSREEIDSAYKLIDIIKDAHCIWEYEDDESEYSEDGRAYDGSYRGRSYRSGYTGNSYARGRGSNAKRYADGRYAPYSRDMGSYRGTYRGYARDDGKQEYVEHLRDMMEDAPDEQTRQSIQRMIQQLEQQ